MNLVNPTCDGIPYPKKGDILSAEANIISKFPIGTGGYCVNSPAAISPELTIGTSGFAKPIRMEGPKRIWWC